MTSHNKLTKITQDNYDSIMTSLNDGHSHHKASQMRSTSARISVCADFMRMYSSCLRLLKWRHATFPNGVQSSSISVRSALCLFRNMWDSTRSNKVEMTDVDRVTEQTSEDATSVDVPIIFSDVDMFIDTPGNWMCSTCGTCWSANQVIGL